MPSFSKRLVHDVLDYRKAHHLSQIQFAKLVNSSQRAISDFEAGTTLPRRKTLDSIYALLYTPPSVSCVAEDAAIYHTNKSFIRWLQDILHDDIPYEELVRLLRDATQVEMARISQTKESEP